MVDACFLLLPTSTVNYFLRGRSSGRKEEASLEEQDEGLELKLNRRVETLIFLNYRSRLLDSVTNLPQHHPKIPTKRPLKGGIYLAPITFFFLGCYDALNRRKPWGGSEAPFRFMHKAPVAPSEARFLLLEKRGEVGLSKHAIMQPAQNRRATGPYIRLQAVWEKEGRAK